MHMHAGPGSRDVVKDALHEIKGAIEPAAPAQQQTRYKDDEPPAIAKACPHLVYQR